MAKKKKLRRYPWDKWFAKKEFRLVRGKDYDCQPHSMSVQIRAAAIERGLVASVSIQEEVIVVTVKKKRKKRNAKTTKNG